MADYDTGQNTEDERTRSEMIQSMRPKMKRDASDNSNNRASLEMIKSVRPRMKRNASDVSNNQRTSLVTTEQHSEAFKAISEALSNSTK